MTLEEVQAKHPRISRCEARREVCRHAGHGPDNHRKAWNEFLVECGDHESYDGAAVLAWLGY